MAKAWFLAALLAFPSLAQAAGLLRDAELEDTLKRFERPIAEQAGLNPDNIHLWIVGDPTLNAFVAGGSNMFIHSGLMMATKDASMLVGVMAHETGHIAGGHLIRGKEAMEGANLGMILAMALGGAAAIAGSGQLGMGVMSAGQQVALRNYLSFSRGQESSADQAALRFLDGANMSATGMLSMFETLRLNETRQFGTVDPYNLTHPLTQDRISHIRSHTMQSDIPAGNVPADFALRHARLRAKLRGFIDAPEYTLVNYPESDQSLPAHMARAIAYFRQGQLPKARTELAAAEKLSPNDGFLQDLKGQILLESGQTAEAVATYRTATHLVPDAPIMLADFGRALLALERRDTVDEAVKALERSTTLDNTNASAWDLLAVAYGKRQDKPKATLAQAESAVLRNEPSEALRYLREIERVLPAGSPARLRAADLRQLAEEQRKKKKQDGDPSS